MGTAEEKSHKTIDDKTIDEIFSEMEQAIVDPQKTFEKYRSANQKAIGCIPYFAPYELVDAAGMYPIELWGGDTEISRANGYYPAFYCSILVTLMERALRGEYDYLSGVIIPTTCDGLRNLEENWKFAVPEMSVMSLVQPANRTHPAAEDYLLSELEEVKEKLEEISGNAITDKALRDSINAYNKQRATMREFDKISAQHPSVVTPWKRHVVYKAAQVLPVRVHTELVGQLNESLASLPEDSFAGLRLVATGILLDSKPLLDELEKKNIAIVGDVLTAESVRFAKDAPGNVDPFVSLAHIWLDVQNTSVALDPTKQRGETLAALAKERKADGALINVTKFCEEEEYDYPVIKKQLANAGVPLLYLETAQQDHINEQATTRIQAFAEMLG